jgi:hypothetical protein
MKFVREQFFLAAAAQNLKRLVRFLNQAPSQPTFAPAYGSSYYPLKTASAKPREFSPKRIFQPIHRLAPNDQSALVARRRDSCHAGSCETFLLTRATLDLRCAECGAAARRARRMSAAAHFLLLN